MELHLHGSLLVFMAKIFVERSHEVYMGPFYQMKRSDTHIIEDVISNNMEIKFCSFERDLIWKDVLGKFSAKNFMIAFHSEG